MNKQKKKGNCLTTCLIILAVICLFPIVAGFGWIAGAIWMIFFRKKLSSDTSKQKKYTIGVSIASMLSLFIFISAMVTAPPSPTSLSLSSPMDGQNLEIDNDYIINIQYNPEDASLSAVTYKIDNPSLASITTDPNDPSLLTLHTKGEGTISIIAIENEIESNTLSFEIIDSARIEREKIAEMETLQSETVQTIVDNEFSEIESISSVETEQETENPLDFNIIFSDTYRNDTTGNWRLAKITENIDIEEYALDYYNNYFKSDNEVHIVINSALETTTRITVMGNLLDVAMMEYVDKEENDAALACSGILLSEYHVNIDTGEIEEIKIDSAESLNEDPHSQTIEPSSNIDVPDPIAQTDSPLPENNPQSEASSTIETSPAPEPEISTPVGDMVWLSATGSKYHRINNCGRMNPNKARQVSLDDAVNMGYERCSKCY